MAIIEASQLAALRDRLGFYPSIAYIAAEARKLRNSLNYDITESQAVSWVLTGVQPEPHRIPMRDIRQAIDNMRDILSGIDNEFICESVEDSINISHAEHHLVYQYTDGLAESDKARVRILTRAIWYND